MRNLQIIILFLFSYHLLLGQDYSKIEDPSGCREAIRSKQKMIKSLSADFTEYSYSEMLEKPELAEGTFLFKKEDKVRWELTEPKKQLILINGTSVRMSQNGKELTNPSSMAVARRIQHLMLDMLSGDSLQSKAFRIAYFENKSNYKLVLYPTSDRMKKYIRQIALVFNRSDLFLHEMTISESENEKVVYQFSNIRQDLPIGDSKFTQL